MSQALQLLSKYKRLIDYVKNVHKDNTILGDLTEKESVLEHFIKQKEGKEFNIVVLAPMKAGKSTLINALLGKDLMPNENEACTLVPTVIQISEFDYNIIKVLNSGTREKLSGDDIEKKFHSDIRAYRKKLADNEGVETIDIHHYEVNHQLYSVAQPCNYKIKLIDSPGPNEMKLGSRSEFEVEAVFDEVLRSANIILYVIDIQYSKAEENEDILLKVLSRRPDLKDNVIFVLNKIDRLATNKGVDISSTVDDVKKFLSNIGFNCNELYFVSSRLAMISRILESAICEDQNNRIIKYLSNLNISFIKRFVKKISKAEAVYCNYINEIISAVKFQEVEVKGQVLQHRPCLSDVSAQLLNQSKILDIEVVLNSIMSSIESEYKKQEQNILHHYSSKVAEITKAYIENNNTVFNELQRSKEIQEAELVDKALFEINNRIAEKPKVNIDKGIIEESINRYIAYRSSYFNSSNMPYYSSDWYEYCTDDRHISFEESTPAGYRQELQRYFDNVVKGLYEQLRYANDDVVKQYRSKILDVFSNEVNKLETILANAYKSLNIKYDPKIVFNLNMNSIGVFDVYLPSSPTLSYDSKSFSKTKGIFIKREVYYIKYRLMEVGEFKSRCQEKCESMIDEFSRKANNGLLEKANILFKEYLEQVMINHLEILNKKRDELAVAVLNINKQIQDVATRNNVLSSIYD